MIHLLLAVIYLSFISLGLPDGLLGAAWPTVYPEFGVPVSASGILFITVSVGTVISSLLSDRLTRRFGPGLVTAVSTAITPTMTTAAMTVTFSMTLKNTSSFSAVLIIFVCSIKTSQK